MPNATEVLSEIKRHGQSMTLRRATVPSGPMGKSDTNTTTDTTVYGQVRGYRPSEIVGDIRQGDRLVVLAASGLTVIPQNGDSILIGSNWHKVIGPPSVGYIEGTPAVYRFTARG